MVNDGKMTIQPFAYFKCLSKLYFAIDLEEQSLSHVNKPRHKLGGYKLGGKRKQNKAPRSQGCAEAGGVICPGVGTIYPPHHKLQSFQPTRPRSITSHSHNDRGGGSEKASFQLSSLPLPGFLESCVRSNGI